MLCLPLPLCSYAIVTTCPFSKTFCPLSSQRHLPVDETHITHEMGVAGIVRLAISQATNRENRSPVTVPDNRCSITEPLDEHQLCTIISHIHEVCCLAYMSACFVTVLTQQGLSRYSTTGEVMCPNTWLSYAWQTYSTLLAPSRSSNTRVGVVMKL